MRNEEKIQKEIERLKNEANRLASFRDIKLATAIERCGTKINALKWVLEEEDE